MNHNLRPRIKKAALVAAALAIGRLFGAIASAQDTKFFVTTGSPDGKLGALSRPAGSQGLETETADDFVLTQPTVISGATGKPSPQSLGNLGAYMLPSQPLGTLARLPYKTASGSFARNRHNTLK
jgi:hypothetical protein